MKVLIVASKYHSLDALREMVNEYHSGTLPEIDRPENAPACLGLELCLNFDELRGGIGVFVQFNSNRDLQVHLLD